MDVSVIFATHNRADVIGDVLNTWREVHKSTKYEYEIICSDDASDDETTTIIEQAVDLPITLIRNEKGGASKARNAALKVATGKIIIFTGDDIFPSVDFVNAHYENYLKYGAYIATLGRIEWHEDLKLNQLMYHITNVGCEQFGFIGLPPYQLIDFRHFYTSNISVSRELLDKVDIYFNTDFDKYGFEDIELGYRLQKCGMRIYYDPDIVVMHHHIYDDVDKFCDRQLSSGEELVVFQQMHDDLEDKCICDTLNCREALEKYLQKSKTKRSVLGYTILTFLKVSKKTTRFIERISQNGKFRRCRKFASVIYAGIFKFYFYYGCVQRIALGRGITKSKLVHFTYMYLKKSYAQIYFDTGYGYSEAESRKWICWDGNEWQIEKKLPPHVNEIRFSPLKNQCYAQIKEAYFVLNSGEKKDVVVEWHNSRNGSWKNGDYTHTKDPQIIINNIADGTEKLVIKMQVNNMKKRNLIKVVKQAAIKLCRKQEIVFNSRKKWEIKYTGGQPRKIQIGIGGVDKVQRNQLITEYQEKISVLGSSVVIADIDELQRGYVTYLYLPQKEALDAGQMMQVVYTLMNAVYDYILVSKSYVEFPQIACKCLEDVFVFSELNYKTDIYSIMKNGLGRYMRLPSYKVEENVFDLLSIYSEVRLENEFILCQRKGQKPVYRVSLREFRYQKEKPLVFVFPIFLAVGGVERNTIEVMRALKEQYEFCLITMERHSLSQGSLHYQLKGICDYIFDLREIVEFDYYLDALYELNEIFHPDIVWLCNNSPWFESHIVQVRKIFNDAAMIAQDVYDTEVGWIEYYKNPEMKLFDRYIAVTELIRDTFIKRYQLPLDKIDVIYSVVDGTKIQRELDNPQKRENTLERYGLERDKKQFAFVGRLTDQKDPIRFLRLVEQVRNNHMDDVHFVLVGDGILGKEVETYILNKKLQDYVCRIPYVDNTPRFIGALDGLILTSVYEGMPIVSIEAMCMSVPVFSTDTGDLKRFVKQNCSGQIIDNRQSDYHNFEKFYFALSEYKENASRCAADMLSFFSATHVAQKYCETFEKGMKKS